MNEHPSEPGRTLGMVVGGSLSAGLEVRLDPEVSQEDIKVGTFVSIQGRDHRFFAVVTDIELGATDQSLAGNPPDVSDPFVAQVVSGTMAFGKIKVEPMLALSVDGYQPAKTVPGHFSPALAATEADIELVFGREDDTHFSIGTPLDMEAKLCLDVEQFVQRSNGVFGKSGTGKTFLTRLLLVGILQNGSASNLVFDMQSEYGWKGSSESGTEVKGLKQLFSSQVAVFSLDEESSKRRGLTPDYVVRVGYEEIEPEDVVILQEALQISGAGLEAVYSLERHYGAKRWLKSFLDLNGQEPLAELAESIGVQQNALAALQRRLGRIQRLGFMTDGSGSDSVKQIMNYLNRGMHVVLEFGRYGNDVAAYVLVANLLTRRIYRNYVERKERAMGDRSQEPRPLVITIEEAHKFLTPEVAGQTIFGTIAREMRKYNVTLLIVDQRPSGIDDEVMSQLGTKITCLLDNDRDVDAVLTGVSGSRKLRSVLAKLEPKQQALAFGHAVPMPVVFQTREYGSAESYKELGFKDAAEIKAQVEREVDELFGPAPAE